MSAPGPRYVCVHGHFYQPPRENPWLEAIEPQPSARPYPNWNLRILDECYQPNAAARIVDADGRIASIANNYERISFNFGPTLLDWLYLHAPDIHAAIVDADSRSRARFFGHGSAMAQAYNHMIMPLCCERDRHTQVAWGVRDFEHHFGRRPEGMWLPETAVCTASLEALAAADIAFTVLAPGQARRIRPLGGGPWQDVSGGRIDPGQVYRANLPSGRSIDLFFYDGATSSAVAFERLLTDGGGFAARLVARPATDRPLLLHIATDGETYGHHHRFGDMALAYALRAIEARPDVELINYGAFRARHPATHEVQIHEHTAWSCAHGVGRWYRDCGCSTGGNPSWNQAWREPLRAALDWARDAMAEVFEAEGAALLSDPWAAREDYIDVILARLRGDDTGAHTPGAAETAFFAAHARAKGGLDVGDRRVALALLEMQRHAMLMYTSCGWFFDDLAGVEGVQILRYAARALELCARVSDRDLEAEFLARLERARSNRPEVGDGRALWTGEIRPTRVDLGKVVAHHAVTALFESGTDAEQARAGERVYCYRVTPRETLVRTAGKAKLVVGMVACASRITGEEATLSFGALHFGDHNLTGGVRPFAGQDAYRHMLDEVTAAFARADLVATHRALDRHFLELPFSLKSLFRDHQERILARILEGPLSDAEATYERLYDRDAPLMRYLTNLGVPLPEAFRVVAEHVANARLARLLEAERPKLARIRVGFEEAELIGVRLDTARMGYLWQLALERAVDRLVAAPDDTDALAYLVEVAELVASMTFHIDMWHTQNHVWALGQERVAAARQRAAAGDDDARRWLDGFTRLCELVRIAV